MIPVEVPAYHGVEPGLALAYSSGARNGFAGAGWSLEGVGVIRRTRTGRGVPSFTDSDVYVFGGQELIPCASAPTSPSCTTGGTHATKTESYLRIKRVGDVWSVWSKNGMRTDFSPILQVPEGTVRWGQTATVDTRGNQSTYTWASVDGDTYPDSVTFGPYTVRIYREPRSDVWTFATGSTTTLGRTTQRLRSIIVWRDSSAIRGYQLTYETAPATLRSRLIAVRQFGKDLAEQDGQITGGTSLPSRTFVYADDPASGVLQVWPQS
jgi:hypothetical protein